MTTPDPTAPNRPEALWRDPARSVAERVEALLAEMTLAEKVAQLGSRWVGNGHTESAGDAGSPDRPGASEASGSPGESAGPAENAGTGNVAPMQDVFAASRLLSIEDASRHGLGHLTRVFGSAPVTVDEGAAEVVRLQRVIVDGSRLGIPAIVHEECLTGFTTYGATVYPAAIAWGATFDPDLVERMAAAIGRDLRAVGAHQGLSPLLDVIRDYRWGRVEETIGEDPYLVAMLGSAYVRGLEGSGIIATLKHFAGYSASRAGRNHGPVPIGRRELNDMILSSFETAVVLGGARSVMNSYSDIDGVPAATDPWLLTEVLRDEWGFEGTVVSDYWSLAFVADMHRTAEDFAEAGAQALAAGVDVELPDALCFGSGLVERVERGELDEALVDRAARRLLTQKVQLGLLDPDWTPEGSVAAAAGRDLDSAENRALAAEVAERSVILLEAGTALPLLVEGRPAPRRIAVVGPCGDDARTFMGCYAFPNHVLPRHPELGLGIEVLTAVEALRKELPDAEIAFEPGCNVLGADRSGFAAAVSAAGQADLCIALVGDRAGMFGLGTSGEGCDAEDLRLPGLQAELVAELIATGTPVVVVVVSGRPYALGEFQGGTAGLVQAFMPGAEGGAVIAGVLSGRIQPSGKLPVQIPRRPGGQPGTYLQPPLGANSQGISNLDPTPLFAFGHGSSYTSFAIDELQISDDEIPTDGEFSVTVRVRNTGARAGTEVVQLYLHDLVAQVTRPVAQLTGFARVTLEPGAGARVRFSVHADRTAFTGRDLHRIVEPGEHEVMVGRSASDLPCSGRVRLTGPLRVVGSDRRLSTPFDVHPLSAAEADADTSAGRGSDSVAGPVAE
jgi:beta-glucosidase